MKAKQGLAKLACKDRRQPLADITNDELSDDGRDVLSDIDAHRTRRPRRPFSIPRNEASDKENSAPPKIPLPLRDFPLFRSKSNNDNNGDTGKSAGLAVLGSRGNSDEALPSLSAGFSMNALGKHDDLNRGLRERLVNNIPHVRPLSHALGETRSGNNVTPHAHPEAFPFQTSPVAPFSTALLQPQTQKTAHGQVVILPSRSVLVDFREGERRRKRKGDEVLVVSPDGTQIQVFSAPHLSTPCCLAESNSTYLLIDLPEEYRKLYDMASKVVEHVKKKVAKLVWHLPSATCTLMANDPQADVEIKVSSSRSTSTNELKTYMQEGGPHALRLHLSRRRRILEMTTQISGQSAVVGEQRKKTLLWNLATSSINEEDWASFTPCERAAMQILGDFLRIVEAMEQLNSPQTDGVTQASALHSGEPVNSDPDPLRQKATNLEAILDRPLKTKKSFPLFNTLTRTRNTSMDAVNASSEKAPSVRSSLSSRALSNINIAPRPRLSPPLRGFPNDTTRKASSTVFEEVRVPSRASTSSRPQSSISVSDSMPPSRLAHGTSTQMRFIPSVGWCIRHGGTEGGKYKIMFLDGVALEVDVDEECIEFVGRDGDAARYTIRDCHAQRQVSERMKVFEEFVSLFDDSRE